MKKPLVSVIMPVFNQEKFVVDAILSVRNQSYQNIEILICDDSSDDATYSIAKAFEDDRRVNCTQNELNVGISRNVNKLLVRAAGKYVCFFSGDDLMHPEKISSQVAYMERNEACHILYHDVDVVDIATHQLLYKYSERHSPREGDFLTLIRHQAFCCGCSVMAKMPSKVYCNENVKYASDWAHYVDILANFDGSIRYLPEVLGQYRRHQNNITKLEFSAAYEEVMEIYDYFAERFPNNLDVIERGRAEREMTFGIKLMLSRQYSKGMGVVFSGLKRDFSGLSLFFKNAAYYISSRLR